jgi:hypothetical protein
MARDRARRAIAVSLLAAALGASAVGCSSEPQDPAEARRERVEERLDATFSRQQARCIVDDLDERTIAALDADADLPADSEALATYTAAVTGCVTGE